MVRDKNGLYLSVPTFFRCPISMDVMKSPVSLCTGVTYDRSSIQTWLDSGHNTCPATMQVLQTTDFVPNLTLRRLIHVWSNSTPPPPISKQEALDSIRNLEAAAENPSGSVCKIMNFAKYSDENRRFLGKIDGFAATIVGVLRNADEIQLIESAVTVLDLMMSEDGIKEQLHRVMFRSNRDCLSPFVLVLQKGSLNSKIESSRVLESLASYPDSQRSITEKQALLYELYNLVNCETNQTVIEAGLSALIAVSSSRPVKKELIRFGIVRAAGKVLAGSDTVSPVIEKALKLLEMVSTCTEGRTAISEDEKCVVAIVRRLMKVSSAATEHGVMVLWSVCYMSRDRTAQEAVMKSNGLTKVLLVMQSNCSAGVRQMCGELVRVFRVNSKSCLASYETKTTHIMPY